MENVHRQWRYFSHPHPIRGGKRVRDSRLMMDCQLGLGWENSTTFCERIQNTVKKLLFHKNCYSTECSRILKTYLLVGVWDNPPSPTSLKKSSFANSPFSLLLAKVICIFFQEKKETLPPLSPSLWNEVATIFISFAAKKGMKFPEAKREASGGEGPPFPLPHRRRSRI